MLKTWTILFDGEPIAWGFYSARLARKHMRTLRMFDLDVLPKVDVRQDNYYGKRW